MAPRGGAASEEVREARDHVGDVDLAVIVDLARLATREVVHRRIKQARTEEQGVRDVDGAIGVAIAATQLWLE